MLTLLAGAPLAPATPTQFKLSAAAETSLSARQDRSKARPPTGPRKLSLSPSHPAALPLLLGLGMSWLTYMSSLFSPDNHVAKSPHLGLWLDACGITFRYNLSLSPHCQ